MCENYLRCHRTLFGNLDDVEYIKIPEEDGMVPGIPSSTCDPSSRQEAASVRPPSRTSSTTTSKYCTSRSGKDTVDQAFVANEILTNLIKACFDPVYGSDHFSIGELLKPPRTSKNTAHKSATTTTTT